MVRFWTSEYSVRYWKIFRIMSPREQFLDFSFVLVPICVTLIATSHRGDSPKFWWSFAAASWFIFAFTLFVYIRGYLCEKQVTRPGLPGNAPNLSLEKERLVQFAAVTFLVLLINLGIALSDRKLQLGRFPLGDFRLFLILLVGLVLQYSAYNRHRYWNAKLDE
jgi:hypothetical protein